MFRKKICRLMIALLFACALVPNILSCAADSNDSANTDANTDSQPTGSITGLSISKNPDTASIASDGSITLTASAKVSGTTAINYTWTISDTDSANLSADSGTSVALTGKNNTEENKSVTVTLTATDSSGNKKTASTVITVSAKTAEETKSLNGVSISGTTEIGASATGTLTATPSYTGDIASEITYTWEISLASDYATVSGNGTTCSITGKNTTESEQTVAVKVTATYGSTSKTATATVKIAGAGQTVTNEFTGLALAPSASSVEPDGTVTITPTVTYTGSLSESDFTVSDWQITEGGEYATLTVPSTGSARASLELTGDNTSILQANNTTTSNQTVTVSVKVRCGETEKTATCSVTVEPSKVTSVSIGGTNSISCSGTTELTAVVAKTGNPASITYKWEFAEGEGGEYASISADGATATVTGTNTTASSHTVTVKVTVSDGTNSVSNTIDVTVEKNHSAVSALFPENGATGAYADTQLVLTFSSTPTLVSGKSVKIYTSTGVLVDTIDILPTEDDSQIPQSGSSYTTNVGNQQLVRVEGNSVYIQPHYNGTNSATKLSGSSSYYVTIDKEAITTSGTLADGTAWNGFSGNSDWAFTTKAAPTVSASTPITVSNDIESTDADFFSVYGALFALAQKSSGDYEIDVAATGKPYYELISINNGGANVTVKGMGTASYGSDVVLEYVNNDYMNPSTHTRATLYFKGSGNLILENITLKNLTERNVSYSADGSHSSSEFQAEAFTYSGSANVAAYNCSFISKQDTILLNSGRGWFYKCHVEGDVDFIWGSASAALFEECEIESILTEKSAYLTETRVGTVGASTVGKGYVFLNSTIKGNGGSNATYLSRLASSNAKSSPSKTTYDQVAFINSTFDSSAKVDASLWLATDAKYPRFIEKDSDGNVNVGWKTYGNTGITPVTTEYAGEITSSLYAMEYNGRYAILNRLYNVDFSAYQTVASASVWDLTSLESEFNASTDSSKNNAFTEPDTSASTTIKWDFTAIADAAAVQSATTTVAATTGTGTLYVDATASGAKFDLRGTDAQFNSGTIAYIPASVGDTISVTLYSGTYTLGSTTASGKTTEITVTASDLTTYNGVSCVALTATGNEYLYNITLEPGEDSGDSGETGDNTIPGSWTWTAADFGDGITTDNTPISDGTELGYVTISGTGATWRVSGSAVYCVQTGKTTNGCLKFTTSETATITIVAASTGSSNTSDAILSTSADTSGAIAEASGAATVIGSNPQTTLTYNNVAAGTYYFGAFPASSNTRGLRVYSITVTAGTASVSSVTISGKTSVEVGSSITLTATPNVSTTSAYTWTVTGGTGSASGSSTTNTLTLTGVTAGTVKVTAGVDGITSTAYTVTVKEAGSTPTISLTDTPTGYAAEGSPSYYTGSNTITINASDANAASTLMTYVKKGNYVIYINGMIDVTSGKLPDSWEDTGNALGSFISSYTNGTYTSWNAWRKAYAGACDETSHYTTGQYTKKSTDALVEGTNDATLDAYQTALATAWKKLIQLPLASNTTIIGLTDESGIRGANISISGISNIMLRNLHLQDAFDPFPHHEYNDGWNSEYDCITIQNTNSYIWIDHCTFEDTISVGWADFAGVKTGDSDAEIIAYPCNSTGTATTTGYEMWQTYDGLCDIKGSTSNVTVSYCIFRNHDKCMLIGNSDSESVTASTRTITLHHNYYQGAVQRLPMARLSYIHNFNNYYGVPATSNGYDQKAAVNARYGVYINSEYNYFDSGLKYSYNSSDSTANLYYYGDAGTKKDATSLSSLTYTTTEDGYVFTIPYTYSDYLDEADGLKTLLETNAGAGVWEVEQ